MRICSCQKLWLVALSAGKPVHTVMWAELQAGVAGRAGAAEAAAPVSAAVVARIATALRPILTSPARRVSFMLVTP